MSSVGGWSRRFLTRSGERRPLGEEHAAQVAAGFGPFAVLLSQDRPEQADQSGAVRGRSSTPSVRRSTGRSARLTRWCVSTSPTPRYRWPCCSLQTGDPRPSWGPPRRPADRTGQGVGRGGLQAHPRLPPRRQGSRSLRSRPPPPRRAAARRRPRGCIPRRFWSDWLRGEHKAHHRRQFLREFADGRIRRGDQGGSPLPQDSHRSRRCCSAACHTKAWRRRREREEGWRTNVEFATAPRAGRPYHRPKGPVSSLHRLAVRTI